MCRLCDKVFNWRKNLENHMKLVHEGKQPCFTIDDKPNDLIEIVHEENISRGKLLKLTGIAMKRQESLVDDTLEVALVYQKSSKMTNKTLNFQMLKHNLGSIITDHEKRDEFSDI